MNVHFSSDKHDWGTPQYIYDYLDNIFVFNLDPCATKENAKCKNYYTEEQDGLSKSWRDKTVFMNPPYGREISKWMEKASSREANVVVCLIPARTDTAWWHDYVMFRASYVLFVRGRIKFEGAEHGAPFPSAIVIYFKDIFGAKFGTLVLDDIRQGQGG